MYSLHQFKKLPADLQMEQLSKSGVPLDLAYTARSTEAVLFAYKDFYVELVVDPRYQKFQIDEETGTLPGTNLHWRHYRPFAVQQVIRSPFKNVFSYASFI